MDEKERRQKRQAAKRQAVDKLDSVAVPVIAAVAVFISDHIESHDFTKWMQLAVIIALFAHYLSLETEAKVFHKVDSSPNRRANRLTGIFNRVRLYSLFVSFTLLILIILSS